MTLTKEGTNHLDHKNEPTPMTLEIDLDVQKVLEFMQRNIKVGRMIGVADAVAQLISIMWSKFPQEQVSPVALHETGMESDLTPFMPSDSL